MNDNNKKRGDPYDKKRWYTVQEVCERFSVSKSTCYRWIRLGYLTAWNPNGANKKGLRLKRSSVEEFEAKFELNSEDFDS